MHVRSGVTPAGYLWDGALEVSFWDVAAAASSCGGHGCKIVFPFLLS